MSQSNNNQREKEKYYVYGHYTQDTGVLFYIGVGTILSCLLYTSPSPRDRTRSRMPSSA